MIQNCLYHHTPPHACAIGPDGDMQVEFGVVREGDGIKVGDMPTSVAVHNCFVLAPVVVTDSFYA
jgi:hypothetical protein